jgi:Family of unknown function (DUF6524)
MTHFNAISLLLRWLVALFGVFATYNPSGYSYYHWLQHDGGYVSLRVLAGVALAIFYVVYLRATLRSLGPIGIGLTFALFGSVAWLLTQWHVVGRRGGGEPGDRGFGPRRRHVVVGDSLPDQRPVRQRGCRRRPDLMRPRRRGA